VGWGHARRLSWRLYRVETVCVPSRVGRFGTFTPLAKAAFCRRGEDAVVEPGEKARARTGTILPLPLTAELQRTGLARRFETCSG
jgi:hypothetical protein